MNPRRLLAAVVAACLVTVTVAFAEGQGLAQPSDPQAPSPPATTDNLVRSLNATTMQAIFEAANVPVEVHKTENGYTYLSGTPQGFMMFVYPLDCEGDSATGNCRAVTLESALWKVAIGAENANLYNRGTSLANAVVYEADAGKPVIEYSFAVDAGVSPEYIRTNLRYFTYNMQSFGKFLTDLQAKAAQTEPASGFAVGKTSGPVLTSERRAGARTDDKLTKGEGAFAPAAK